MKYTINNEQKSWTDVSTISFTTMNLPQYTFKRPIFSFPIGPSFSSADDASLGHKVELSVRPDLRSFIFTVKVKCKV
jgi:hypothetical protein